MENQMLEYQDPIYGIETIGEPVLLDLLETAAVQRLGQVLQHGITGLLGLTSPISRLDHSLGTMLLVRRLGGGVPEQIAALLHDVSHTAFSHVIDYVVDDHDGQSFHDKQKEAYVAETAVPNLLARYGYDWQWLIQEEQFPLLEQPAPRLCADRIDYFLRDSRDLGLAEPADIAWLLSHLTVVDTAAGPRIAVNDLDAARWLGQMFMAADDKSWANFREVGLYELTAQAIKRALTIGLITEADFWLTDAQLWQKLQAATDDELARWLRLVNLETRFVWDEAQPTFWVSTKLRAIDPDVVLTEGDEIRPLSQHDPHFARQRHDYLQSKAGAWPMRVVAPYRIVLLMGVAGSGKTTVGRLLAQTLGWPFFDGDDFHSQANIDKMAAGQPLTDADRQPWLQNLRTLIERQLAQGETAVIACSALKESYRTQLLPPDSPIALVHLTGSYELIQERLQQRRDHFFTAELLADQYAALEPPAATLTVNGHHSPADIVAIVRQALAL
jgi:uncharacterized protein